MDLSHDGRRVEATGRGRRRLSVESFSTPAASGDLWSLVDTPFGQRLIVGDVAGHGAGAAVLAGQVLEAWRPIAQREPSAGAIALRLDALVAEWTDEGFVTALIMTLPGPGVAEAVCCGHPPPLMLRGGSAVWAESLEPTPPLGLMALAGSWARAQPLPFREDDGMLVVTDGVTESRDPGGRFYPLPERAAALSPHERPGFFRALVGEVTRWPCGELSDDTLLLFLRWEPAG